jgi:hypothetical protein
MSSFAMSASAAPVAAAAARARVPRRRAAVSRASSTRARAIENETATEATAEEAMPESRAADEDIPAPVGTATKEEFMAWMTGAQRLPGQKLDLVVDLPEGRGLVAREEVRKGDSLLEIPDATLITVGRAVAESKLGPKLAELQEWSLLAAFLAEQALALEQATTAVSSPSTSARCLGEPAASWTGPRRMSRRCWRGRRRCARRATARRAWRRPSSRSAALSRSSRPARCAGRSTFSSRA